VWWKWGWGDKGVLFSTDVAARGLDIPGVDWILQVDCPTDMDDYLHRSGRTARMGHAGETLMLISPHEVRRHREKEGTCTSRSTSMRKQRRAHRQTVLLSGHAWLQMGYVERLRGRGVVFAATEAETLLRALPPAPAAAALSGRLRKELQAAAMGETDWQRAATYLQLCLEAHLLRSPAVRPAG
jgi:superfamily II DNA/RNA helicase